MHYLVFCPQFPTLDPATHAYSFWEGIPIEGRAAFGKMFRESRSLHGVVVVQVRHPPRRGIWA